MRISIFIFMLPVFLLQPCFGQEVDEFVARATQTFQKGQYQEAADLFKKALDEDPNNPTLLYNWGLSLYKLNQKGYALGAWRKALAISPTFTRAQKAVSFAEKDVPRAAFAEDSFWETYRPFFKNTPLHQLLFVTAILLAISGFLLLRYLGQRRQALSEEAPMPSFPTVLMAAGILFIGVATLTASKFIDTLDIRATVLNPPAAVRTSPDAQATVIAELPEGGEVILRRYENGWAQISYPGGITGWIELNKILPSTGKRVW